jgi:uncharacterized protein DUF6916
LNNLAALTHAHFEACRQQPFVIDLDGRQRLPLDLVEVHRPSGPPSGGRQLVSLVFRGPRQPVLPQQVYTLTNDTLGRLEIFLVPIGPDEAGVRYEAVFG